MMVSNGSLIAEVAPDLIRYANGLAYRRGLPGGPCVPVWQVTAEQDGPTARQRIAGRPPGQGER